MSDSFNERASTSSAAEDAFVELFAQVFGLDKVQLLSSEFPVEDIYGATRYIDYALKTTDARIAFEIDGLTWHHPDAITAEKFEDDLLRQNSLIHQGWRVFRWTDRELTSEPERVKEQLALFLESISELVSFDDFLPKQSGETLEHQRQFFSPLAAEVSEPSTLLKYDLEISGFGSAALGHVCLLNLKNQTYPGSEGTKSRGWPTWTVPVMRWAKEQGGVTGYPHSDMYVDPAGYADRLISVHDEDGDQLLSRKEIGDALLCDRFETIDDDEDRRISPRELTAAAENASQQLPNYVLPAMRGAGSMEIFVSAAEGVCDFISAMDTGRIGEWNTWYHLMNAGMDIAVSGETDFPCMSSRRVGQGRVYVKLADAPVEQVDFAAWCEGLRKGRSYVSDGFAHAPVFNVDGHEPGGADIELDRPESVAVKAKVAFAPQTPAAMAHGTLASTSAGRRAIGDTRVLHAPRNERYEKGGERLVEVIVNGRVAASQQVPADGKLHEVAADVKINQSSWVALRQFPQLHTNPVKVIVGGRPIRASRESAVWCAESVRLLWENRSKFISAEERGAARQAYLRAIAEYNRRAAEAK